MELETKLALKEACEHIALLGVVGDICGNKKLKKAINKFVKSSKNLIKTLNKIN